MHWYSVAWLLLILVIATSLWSKIGREQLKIPSDPLFLSLVSLACWLFVSQLWTVAFGYAQGLLLAVFLTFSLFAVDRGWSSMRQALILVGIGVAVLTIYQGYVANLTPAATFSNRNSNGAFLSLLLFLAMGWFMQRDPHGKLRIALLTLIYLFCLAMLTAGGRGALFAFLLGLAIFGVLNWRSPGQRNIKHLVMVLLLAFVTTQLPYWSQVSQTSVDRFIQLGVESNERWLIWDASFELAVDVPWYGLGPGTFWLFYPAYRHSGEGSAGYHAHNDYLEILVELGYPGLLLVLTAMFVLAVRYIRCRSSLTIEDHGLFAGLLAMSVHSMLTFNFYVVSIQIVAGIFLGRLHHRLYPDGPAWILSPIPPSKKERSIWSTTFSIRALRIVVVLLAIVIGERFFSIGLAYAMTHGVLFPKLNGTLSHQIIVLNRAAHLDPAIDLYPIVKGELLRKSALQVKDAQKQELIYQFAVDSIDRGIELNPVRANNHYQRAVLYYQMGSAKSDEWKIAEASARKALSLNPRLVAARILLARILSDTGNKKEALELLLEGLREPIKGKDGDAYLKYGAEVAKEMGKAAEAERFLARLK